MKVITPNPKITLPKGGVQYKLAGPHQGSFGMDVEQNVASMEPDLDKMSLVIVYADGKRRDGVGDLLEVGGIDVERHTKNPIILFDHGKQVVLPVAMATDRETGKYTNVIDPVTKTAKVRAFFYQGTAEPIGSENVDINGNAPFSGGKSLEYEHAKFCEQLYHLCVNGYVKGGSIGYQVKEARPLQPDYSTGVPAGQHLLSVLMLEASAVVMPANQDTVSKCLSLKEVCGKPISPYLIKAFAVFAPEKKVTTFGWTPELESASKRMPIQDISEAAQCLDQRKAPGTLPDGTGCGNTPRHQQADPTGMGPVDLVAADLKVDPEKEYNVNLAADELLRNMGESKLLIWDNTAPESFTKSVFKRIAQVKKKSLSDMGVKILRHVGDEWILYSCKKDINGKRKVLGRHASKDAAIKQDTKLYKESSDDTHTENVTQEGMSEQEIDFRALTFCQAIRAGKIDFPTVQKTVMEEWLPDGQLTEPQAYDLLKKVLEDLEKNNKKSIGKIARKATPPGKPRDFSPPLQPHRDQPDRIHPPSPKKEPVKKKPKQPKPPEKSPYSDVFFDIQSHQFPGKGKEKRVSYDELERRIQQGEIAENDIVSLSDNPAVRGTADDFYTLAEYALRKNKEPKETLPRTGPDPNAGPYSPKIGDSVWFSWQDNPDKGPYEGEIIRKAPDGPNGPRWVIQTTAYATVPTRAILGQKKRLVSRRVVVDQKNLRPLVKAARQPSAFQRGGYAYTDDDKPVYLVSRAGVGKNQGWNVRFAEKEGFVRYPQNKLKPDDGRAKNAFSTALWNSQNPRNTKPAPTQQGTLNQATPQKENAALNRPKFQKDDQVKIREQEGGQWINGVVLGPGTPGSRTGEPRWKVRIHHPTIATVPQRNVQKIDLQQEFGGKSLNSRVVLVLEKNLRLIKRKHLIEPSYNDNWHDDSQYRSLEAADSPMGDEWRRSRAKYDRKGEKAMQGDLCQHCNKNPAIIEIEHVHPEHDEGQMMQVCHGCNEHLLTHDPEEQEENLNPFLAEHFTSNNHRSPSYGMQFGRNGLTRRKSQRQVSVSGFANIPWLEQAAEKNIPNAGRWLDLYDQCYKQFMKNWQAAQHGNGQARDVAYQLIGVLDKAQNKDTSGLAAWARGTIGDKSLSSIDNGKNLPPGIRDSKTLVRPKLKSVRRFKSKRFVLPQLNEGVERNKNKEDVGRELYEGRPTLDPNRYYLEEDEKQGLWYVVDSYSHGGRTGPYASHDVAQNQERRMNRRARSDIKKFGRKGLYRVGQVVRHIQSQRDGVVIGVGNGVIDIQWDNGRIDTSDEDNPNIEPVEGVGEEFILDEEVMPDHTIEGGVDDFPPLKPKYGLESMKRLYYKKRLHYKKFLEDHTPQQAYSDGYSMHEEGASLQENPYDSQKMHELWVEWTTGWRDAEEKIRFGNQFKPKSLKRKVLPPGMKQNTGGGYDQRHVQDLALRYLQDHNWNADQAVNAIIQNPSLAFAKNEKARDAVIEAIDRLAQEHQR